MRDPLEYNGSYRDDPPTTDDPGAVSTDPVLRDGPMSGQDDPNGRSRACTNRGSWP